MSTPPTPPSFTDGSNNNYNEGIQKPVPSANNDGPVRGYTPPMQPATSHRSDTDFSATRLITPQSSGEHRKGTFSNSLTMFVIVCAVIAVIGLGTAAYFMFVGKDDKHKYDYEQPVESRTDKEGSIAESEHRIADDMRAKEGAEASDEVPSQADKPLGARSNGLWREGHNKLIGTFIYEGAKYGFTLTLDYSSATGRVTNTTFEAHSYGGASRIKTAVLSGDGTVLNVSGTASGTKTVIDVKAAPGSPTFTGTMTRGDHNGSCTLTLQ